MVIEHSERMQYYKGQPTHGSYCPDPDFRCICGLFLAIEHIYIIQEFLILMSKDTSNEPK